MRRHGEACRRDRADTSLVAAYSCTGRNNSIQLKEKQLCVADSRIAHNLSLWKLACFMELQVLD